MEDSGIVKLFLERSERALTELSDKYGAALLRLAENIIGSREDAEECVNTALLRVWDSIPPNEPDMLGAYALKITRNLAINRAKYNAAGKRGTHALCIEELEECIPAGRSAEEACEEKELTREIEGFIKGLGRTDRLIFVRRYWYLDPTAEIAGQCGMSDAAVRARLSRLRKRLKDHLGSKGVEL